MGYPRMLRVRQRAVAPALPDVAAAVHDELARIGVRRLVRAGQQVAVTAGSRGIANLPTVLRTLIAELRDAGAAPFLVPAMGSHGGATAEGQRQMLEGLGITEDAVGAPIRSGMETVVLGNTREGVPVHCDRHAAAADAIVLVNRIKPHTTFSGPVESGLVKMATLGLGKQVGASTYHRAIVEHSFERVVPAAAELVLERGPVAFGLGIVENGAEETARVAGLLPGDLVSREAELLRLARDWMARLPVDDADLLVVDEMGKNVSGSGMDTNVIGRKPGTDGPPRIRRVFVRDLTAATRGNGYGVGFADFTTSRLVRALDYRVTIVNCLAAAHPEAGAIPIHFETDRNAIDVALATSGLGPTERARVVRIRNTLQLAALEVSEALRDALVGGDNLEVDDEARELAFDATGNLLPFRAA